jgi:hypothetical protein
MIPLQKIKKIGITWHHCDGTGFREQDQTATSPMELHYNDYIRKHASLSVLFRQHSGTGLLALRHARHITDSRDSKEIQEIQRIKNIITNTSLKKMGQMQVDVRQRPDYKAVVL